MSTIDIWRGNSGSSTVLWDMLEGPMPAGLLGVGDPDVHLIDDRWTMFLGGFSTSFHNRLYQASLPADAGLREHRWRFDQTPLGTVRPLTADPPRGAWDSAGMHTPSYVLPAAGQPARIFYTGRANSRHYGPGSKYSIGVLERHGGLWQRAPEPVIEGDLARPSVLEPLVIHTGEIFRMWYQANPHEVGPGEQPDNELRCTDSADGLTWSDPVVFSTPRDGFFDNAVTRWGSGWLMVLARGSNLHGTTPFPDQGLWLTTSPSPDPRLSDWATPQRLIDTDLADTPGWCGAGTYGPTAARDQTGLLVVFTGGTRTRAPWARLALQQLRQWRRPPIPAPYQLATGALSVELPAPH